jgi:hypothetical protein
MAYVKDPTEKKDYVIDWTNHLGTAETVTTSTWAVSPVGITLATPNQPALASPFTRTRLTGGTEGIPYRVTNHVITSTGQEFERSFVVNVADL